MAWALYLYAWLAGMLGRQQARMSEVLEISARAGIALTPWAEAVAQYYAHAIEFWQRSGVRSEEHTSELQSLMRISYAVFCLKKKIKQQNKAYNDGTEYQIVRINNYHAQNNTT